MKRLFKKLFLAKPEVDNKPVKGGIEKRIKNIRSIWHNEHQDDIGIEKMLRLFLAISQFLFLGIYIKHVFGKKGIGYQELAVDFFVLFKVVFPFALVYFDVFDNNFVFALMIWFLLETMFYLATLVFASDIFSRPRSYRRVGYGEFYPVNFAGKFLVSTQVMIFFIVVVMFLSFFSNKVEQKGYFDHTNTPD